MHQFVTYRLRIRSSNGAAVFRVCRGTPPLLLGLGRAWGSETTALDSWWRAVQSSRAFARLGSVCNAPEQAYWPSRRETFARSFSQWTATRAAEPALLEELERRAAGAGRQWEPADFAPIAAALDDVLLPLAA